MSIEDDILNIKKQAYPYAEYIAQTLILYRWPNSENNIISMKMWHSAMKIADKAVSEIANIDYDSLE